ncbi:hypothetical protein CVO77_07470 [Sphingopyxis lindanitolerans]|uniref:Terminase n=1 Tax=Sphingopyxis lindanitolerans TaxID=2054227 RepID=A0A2S8B7E5_9SPHN|nr:hypothetical protein [Sphingopyxis lindanitolerans]PQM28324.1 hypothetical protein CVO77_07470 [Sphingopyxis lindanitolerans]
MDKGREDEIVPQHHRPVQAKTGKPGGWTRAKREAFLVELAASCNIVRAAALVGMGQSGAYRLRKREPDFAAQWQAALEIGYERLETALVRRALETVGEFPVEALDERSEPVEKMTVDQAIRILTFHRESIRQGQARTRKPQARHVATQEETDAALIKRIRIVERQRAAPAPSPEGDAGADAREPRCA